MTSPVAALRRRRAPTEQDAQLEAWVEAARSGDTTAFGWIWTRLSGRVTGYLIARGVAHPDDVTSEVFLAAFTSLATFTGDAATFRSWLFTIAHHKSVDERRRHRATDEYTPADDPRALPSAETTALAGILDADVAALLARLTDDQREVLLMRVLADMSVDQVAVATGRPSGAVKQLYHRAVATAQRGAAGASAGTGTVPAPRVSTSPTPQSLVTSRSAPQRQVRS